MVEILPFRRLVAADSHKPPERLKTLVYPDDTKPVGKGHGLGGSYEFNRLCDFFIKNLQKK